MTLHKLAASDTCDGCGAPAPPGWPRTWCDDCDAMEAEASRIELAALVAEREANRR